MKQPYIRGWRQLKAVYVGTGNASNLSDRLTIALAREVQEDMLKAGYVATVPLIGDKDG